MSNNLKIATVAAAAVVVLLVASFIGFSSNKGDSLGFTVEEIDGIPHITITADYGFDDYLETGSCDLEEFYDYIQDNVTDGKRIPGINPISCSAFTITKEDSNAPYAGRNFDFRYSEPGIIHTNPNNGYSSMSTVDLRMFGETGATISDMKKDIRYLSTPYIPLDGINEKGVFVCVNMVHINQTVQEDVEGNVHIFMTSMLRVILDNAASTEEAIELASHYNMNTDINYHIFVVDSTGDSRVIEVVDNVRYVTPTDIVTNHYITEFGPPVPETDNSLLRYDTIAESMEGKDSMSELEVKSTMMSVMQDDPDHIHFTRWTVIYDLEDLVAVIWICQPMDETGTMDYDTPHRYAL